MEDTNYSTNEARELQQIIQDEILPEIEEKGGDFFEPLYSLLNLSGIKNTITEEARKKHEITHIIQEACKKYVKTCDAYKKTIEFSDEDKKNIEMDKSKKTHSDSRGCDKELTEYQKAEKMRDFRQLMYDKFKAPRLCYNNLKNAGDLPILEKFVEEALQKNLKNIYSTNEAQELQKIIQKEILPKIKEKGEEFFNDFYDIQKTLKKIKEIPFILPTGEEIEKNKINYVIRIACSRLSPQKYGKGNYESPTHKKILEERKNIPLLQQPMDAPILIKIRNAEIDRQKYFDILKGGHKIYDTVRKSKDLPILEKFIEEELKEI